MARKQQNRTTLIQFSASLSLLLIFLFPLIISVYLLRSTASLGLCANRSYPCSQPVFTFPEPISLSGYLILTAKVIFFFSPAIIILSQTRSYHCNLLICIPFTMSSIPNRCLESSDVNKTKFLKPRT